MKTKLPFLTESGSDFQQTVTIGSFSNGDSYNSFDDNFTAVANDFKSGGIVVTEDTNNIIRNSDLWENYRDRLIAPIVESCRDKTWDEYGNVAGLANQIKEMMDNRRDMLIRESTSVGQLLPIKMIDFPLIVKDHLKNVIKDVMQCEVTKSPLVKKQIQHTWIVDKQTKKRYEYPQCFYRNQYREIFDAGKGHKLADTPVAVPAFNFNIIENLVDDVAIPERERISFNTKIVKAILADGTEIPMDMRINMSDGSWLGGLIDKEVTLKDGSTTQVQDCLTGHVDFVNNTTSISSASGQVVSAVFEGYLMNDLNERAVTFDYSREEREWKIEDGHRADIPYSIEDLEDAKALLDLDLYKMTYTNLSEYLVNMEDADGLGWLDDEFKKYDGVVVDPLDFVGFIKHQQFDCDASYSTTALPCEYIETMLKFLIDRFVIDIADTAKLEDLTFVIYGNPRYVSLLGDKVNWVVRNGDSIGGVKLTYSYGIMNSGGVKVQVVSSDKIDAATHKGLRVIPYPTHENKMTFKHYKYTTHILTAANSAYKDPDRPGGSYTNIVGISRYTNAALQGIQGHIDFVNEDQWIKID